MTGVILIESSEEIGTVFKNGYYIYKDKRSQLRQVFCMSRNNKFQVERVKEPFSPRSFKSRTFPMTVKHI